MTWWLAFPARLIWRSAVAWARLRWGDDEASETWQGHAATHAPNAATGQEISATHTPERMA